MYTQSVCTMYVLPIIVWVLYFHVEYWQYNNFGTHYSTITLKNFTITASQYCNSYEYQSTIATLNDINVFSTVHVHAACIGGYYCIVIDWVSSIANNSIVIVLGPSHCSYRGFRHIIWISLQSCRTTSCLGIILHWFWLNIYTSKDQNYNN